MGWRLETRPYYLIKTPIPEIAQIGVGFVPENKVIRSWFKVNHISTKVWIKKIRVADANLAGQFGNWNLLIRTSCIQEE
jgi:hypothetical protein